MAHAPNWTRHFSEFKSSPRVRFCPFFEATTGNKLRNGTYTFRVSYSMTCAECVRLWRIYAKTTTLHVELINQHAEAAALQDVIRLAELDSRISQAERQRDEAKANIRQHESELHGSAGYRVAQK